MKKVYLVVLLMLVFLVAGCGNGGGDNTPPHLPNLTVNVEYTGTVHTVSVLKPLIIQAYKSSTGLLTLDKSASAFYDWFPFYSEPDFAILPTDPDTYYILAFVDANNNNDIDTGEPYIIYNNQSKSGAPTPFVFSSDASITLTFGDTNTW